MASPYHIGAQNIARRLGYRSRNMVYKLIDRDGLPAYKRYQKNPRGTGSYLVLVISESALTAWELAKGAHFVDERWKRRALKLEQ